MSINEIHSPKIEISKFNNLFFRFHFLNDNMYQTLKKNKDPEVINILLNKIEKCNMQVNNASVILFSVARKIFLHLLF